MPPEDHKQSIDPDAVKTHAHEPQKVRKKRARYRSRRARFTLAFVRLAAITYAALLGTLVMLETRLVYPGAYLPEDGAYLPEDGAYLSENGAYLSENGAGQDAVSGVQTVAYDSTDDVTLRGRLIERGSSDDIVLFLHGNGVKAKWLDDWLVVLADEFQATVMAAEYRGYEDDLTPDEKGVLADCFAARDYLCERFQKSPAEIILYGQSLGGGCAVALASQGGAKALVLERTFDRMVNVAADQYPFLPVRMLMRNRYDSIAKLTVYDGPLVMLHGTADQLIPMHHGRKLFESAPSRRKQWIAVEGMGHNDPLPRQQLRRAVAKVKQLISEPSG